MKYLFMVTALVSSSFLYADEELGKEFELKKTSGKLSFGIHYTLGAIDPDGNNWMITFAKQGTLPTGASWNLYDKDSKSFVFTEWKPALEGESFQAKVADPDAKKVLPSQANLVFVFKLASGERIHLRIGDMCRDEALKGHFTNMTNNKRCDEITADDVKTREGVSHRSRSKRNH